MFRRLLAFVLFVAFAACQAQADLVLTHDGETDSNSSLNGNPISAGTSFELQVVFPVTPYFSLTGIGEYAPISATAVVGGTSYTILNYSDYNVVLIDPSSPYDPVPGSYYANFDDFSISEGFQPSYTSSSASGWSAVAPTPTVFSNLVAGGVSVRWPCGLGASTASRSAGPSRYRHKRKNRTPAASFRSFRQ